MPDLTKQFPHFVFSVALQSELVGGGYLDFTGDEIEIQRGTNYC